MDDYSTSIARELSVRPTQAASVIDLLDAGNTLPFIARYRKEATGGLDEEQIRHIQVSVESLRKLDERRSTIIAEIEGQDKLTPQLHEQILAAETSARLEDLYQPYKPKRRTRASMAREKGLQPLAAMIIDQVQTSATPEQMATKYLCDEAATVEDVLAGARDIVAETISDHPQVRSKTREKALHFGLLRAAKIDGGDDPRETYRLYYSYDLRVDRLRPHQVLALNRGEAQKILRISIDVDERDWRRAIVAVFRPDRRSSLANQLAIAAEDGAHRLLLPAIERDVRRVLTELAEAHAIQVFGSNLRGLLTQPPLNQHNILAVDPGFRTGCKAAVVDTTGRVMDTATIYPHAPQRKSGDAASTLTQLINRHNVTLIAIGNGTASRETEQFAADLIQNNADGEMHYLIVSEAGASVYSASPLARAELPDLDVSMRGAVSLARRVLDPLAELVKIDPKSIGIGMYQHDVDQKRLGAELDAVVESVVNQVGVDANGASPALLTYVAGIGPRLAERIVTYRNEFGMFHSRQDLLKVNGLGPKAFEQAAGFLRIRNGSNSLDSSAIHPESYGVAERVISVAGITHDMSMATRKRQIAQLADQGSLADLANELGTGEPTLRDILEQLVRPGRDPREDVPAPILRSDVLSMEDLRCGMLLEGTVRNVVDFGAFVDIGVKQDGLLHRSQLPFDEQVGVGDVISVEILGVEKERGRISLGWAQN